MHGQHFLVAENAVGVGVSPVMGAGLDGIVAGYGVGFFRILTDGDIAEKWKTSPGSPVRVAV